jgi:hydrogenase nickel incorporation protein HypB
MCETCGCGSEHDNFTLTNLSGGQNPEDPHSHPHPHPHPHSHAHTSSRVIPVETDILSKNNLLAERNRGYFEAKHIKAVNLVSSPGSGKTTLLEKIIKMLAQKRKIFVIEGDQQTANDAERIEAAGAHAVQVNTGSGCHLDAHIVNHAVNALQPEDHSVLFIENVGNLVCPALFDLGEQLRVVIASTAEGEDKPLKYPNIFQTSDICLLNKIDLLPYLDFDENVFRSNLEKVKPGIQYFRLSAKTGEGLNDFIALLQE